MQNATTAYRSCPYCAEKVRAEATTCRFCDRDITVHVVFQALRPAFSPKALHQATLKLMRYKRGAFNYQELKAALGQKGSPLIKGVPFAEAEEFIKFAANCDVDVSIEKNIIVALPPTTATEQSIPTEKPSGFVIRLSGYHFILLGCIIFSAWYLYTKLQAPQPVASEVNNAAPQPALTEIKRDAPQSAPSGSSFNNSPSTIQEALIQATATITDGGTVGSGFFVHPQGYLVTNVHVIEKMRNPVVVTESGRQYPATVVRTDPSLDIALLKTASGGFPYLHIGDATQLARGETVWTVGAPHGLSFTLTKGIVSYVGRNVKGVAYLQTDASINPGNSGGPMINEKGQVVGVNTFIVKGAEGLGFALPINYLFMVDRPILQGVVGSDSPNSTMRNWMAFAANPDVQPASGGSQGDSGQSWVPGGGGANPRYTKLTNLLAESKRLDGEFSGHQSKINQTLTQLVSEQKSLDAKYKNTEALSISEETQLGKQIKELNRKILSQQITLLEKSDAYYGAKERTFKEALDYADDSALKQQLQSVLIDVRAQLDKSRLDLEGKRAELKTLEGQAY